MSRDTPKGGETQGRAAARARAGATSDRRPIGFHASQHPISGEVSPALASKSTIGVMEWRKPVALSVALRGRAGGGMAELGGEVAGTLRASQGGGDKAHVLTSAQEWPKRVAPTLGACFGDKQGLEDQHIKGGAGLFVPDIARSVTTNGMRFCATQDNFVSTQTQVRRLTPVECERLQGFPDGYTGIPGGADGPRYMALGNSMAVPVMRWIGQRIASVDSL